VDITHQQVRAAYAFLRECPPFDGWGLPPAEALRFVTLKTRQWQGDYLDGRIRLSVNKIATADRLLVVTAHEMVHLMQDLLGEPDTHNARFRALAQEVCASLGFDPKEF